MAPQPKRKHSGLRGRTRIRALTLASQQLIPCPSCTKLVKSHRVCPFCGFYAQRKVIETTKKPHKEEESQPETTHENSK